MKYSEKIMNKPKISNKEKILSLLQENDKSYSVKDLAEKTGIPYKNIHRNLNQLSELGLLTRTDLQIGRAGYVNIGLTSKGKDFMFPKKVKKPKIVKGVPIPTASQYETFQDEFQVQDISFGIRFYSWLAMNLKIPNYSRLNLTMLKLKVGLELITQSHLVDMRTVLKKMYGEVK